MSSFQPSEPSSAASTPRSEQHHPPPPPHRWHHHPHQHDGGGASEEEEVPGPRVRLMCSFGGRILPRPHDHQLRYVGGETRIIAVPRFASFAALLAKLAKLLPVDHAGAGAVQVKYQLPHEDLDALISVTSDEDVEIMMEEHERLAAANGGAAARTPRLRLFLFPAGGGTGAFGSIQDAGDDTGARREQWFLDVLNSRAGAAARLERGRSEASSVLSELPDYLFGLDNNSDQAEPVQNRSVPTQTTSEFPDSPVRQTPIEPPPETPISDTKRAGSPNPLPVINTEMLIDEPVQHAAIGGYPGSRTWQYVAEPVPVYYVPASVPQQQTGPVPIPLHVSYSSRPCIPGPLPVVYRHPVQGFNANPMTGGPVFVGGLPVAQAGPVGPYGLPTMVHGPLGGPRMMVSVNPTAGVVSRGELVDAVHKGDQSVI